MEWLIGGVVVWFIYRILTVGSRRNKYFMEAIIWKTGGIAGTGTIDIHQAVSLFEKASSLGHAQASFELGVIYEDGWSHPTSSRSDAQIAPNEALSCAYFRKCQTQSAEVYTQLKSEREEMQKHINMHIQSMMETARKNREDEGEYNEEDEYEISDAYDSEADEIFHQMLDRVYSIIIDKAYDHKGPYEADIGWNELMSFAIEHLNAFVDDSRDELEFEFSVECEDEDEDLDLNVRVALNVNTGNSVFIVVEKQELERFYEKAYSGEAYTQDEYDRYTFPLLIKSKLRDGVYHIDPFGDV